MKIKKTSNLFLLLCFFLTFNFSLFAQSKSNFYINPMIKFGYAFKTGFTYGFDITLGIFRLDNYLYPTSLAISTKFYYLNFNGFPNRILSLNFVAENDFTTVGLGFGEIKRRWGYKNKNIFKAYAVVTDLGFSSGVEHVPWIGVSTIHPAKNYDWFGKRPIMDLYVYFRQPNIQLLKN